MKTPLLLLCSLLLTSSLTQAQTNLAPIVDPTVQKVLNQLYTSSGQPKKKVSPASIMKTMSGIVDWTTLVRRALGRNGSKLTAKQQKEIVNLTSQLIVKSYTDKLAGTSRPTVKYSKTTAQGSGRALLNSTFTIGRSTYKGGYRLIKMGSKWRCYDILIEGTSVVSSYRSQFDQHFRKGTADQLIAKLKAQL